MTGQLTTASTITVQGSAFSVGGSTLVVTGGKVGIGTASPSEAFEVGTPGNIGDRKHARIGGYLGIDTYAYNTLGTNVTNDMRFGAYNSGAAPYTAYGVIQTPLNRAVAIENASTGIIAAFGADGADQYQTYLAGPVGIGTKAPASKLHVSSGTFFGDGNVADIIMVGTPLNATTHYARIDTLAADTAGPPASGDCDAATEVGRQVMSTRYSATAEHRIWYCTQTGAATYGWKYLGLQTP